MQPAGTLETLCVAKLGRELGELLGSPSRCTLLRGQEGRGDTGELERETDNVTQPIGLETLGLSGVGRGGGGKEGVNGDAARGDECLDRGIETGLGLRRLIKLVG